jgi:hypothetical protein
MVLKNPLLGGHSLCKEISMNKFMIYNLQCKWTGHLHNHMSLQNSLLRGKTVAANTLYFVLDLFSPKNKWQVSWYTVQSYRYIHLNGQQVLAEAIACHMYRTCRIECVLPWWWGQRRSLKRWILMNWHGCQPKKNLLTTIERVLSSNTSHTHCKEQLAEVTVLHTCWTCKSGHITHTVHVRIELTACWHLFILMCLLWNWMFQLPVVQDMGR